MRTLRRRPYDLVIDLQGLLKSAFWTSLARSPRKIGFDRTREYSYLALTERLPPYDPDEHAVRRYLRVAQYLGAAGEPVRFRLALPAGTGQDLEYLWTEKTGPLIVMHPGTRWPSKHWPPESFAALADALTRERQARVVFTGSPADRAFDLPYPVSHADHGPRPERPDRLKILGPIILSGRRRRHHRHRPHASGRGRGHPGGRRLRPHRALAHRSLWPPAPGGAHRPCRAAPVSNAAARPRIVSPVWG